MGILPLKSAAASEEGASLLTASEDAASGAASLPGASDAAVAALRLKCLWNRSLRVPPSQEWLLPQLLQISFS